MQTNLRKTKSRIDFMGFTLIELIVVISILAILGTIAFISYGNFQADARDAKRSSDLNAISSKMAVDISK